MNSCNRMSEKKESSEKKKDKAMKLSDVFIQQNKFLPDKMFSMKKIQEYSLGVPVEE